jgi:hypothetical protein
MEPMTIGILLESILTETGFAVIIHHRCSITSIYGKNLFCFWRQFDQMPKIMSYLFKVRHGGFFMSLLREDLAREAGLPHGTIQSSWKDAVMFLV